VRPLTIAIRLPEAPLPSRLEVSHKEVVESLQVHPQDDGSGRVGLPCSAERST
jgi:hypothetical protein